MAQLIVYNNNSKTQLTKHTKLNHQVGSVQKYQKLIEAANDTHIYIYICFMESKIVVKVSPKRSEETHRKVALVVVVKKGEG
jgi:hypothetical protein